MGEEPLYGGPRGVGVSYERDTPVGDQHDRHVCIPTKAVPGDWKHVGAIGLALDPFAW